MADHKSAIKRHKQSLKRKARNTTVKSSLKSVTKKVEAAVTSNNAKDAVSALKQAVPHRSKVALRNFLNRANKRPKKISRHFPGARRQGAK